MKYFNQYYKQHISPPPFLKYGQRFKIIYFLMAPWDPQTMILMGPRELGMGPIIDVFSRQKF